MRKKSLAPRKRPRSTGAGSSGPSRPPPSLNEEHRHQFRDLVNKKTFKPNACLDWDVIGKYGLTNDFQQLLADPAWENLFSINENTYRGVTLEVLSSFKITFPNPILGLRNQVSFSAFGKYYNLTMHQFCGYTGLYSEDELQSDEFQTLHSTWPHHLTPNEFWSSLASTGPYNHSESRGTHFHNNSHRILHWLLVHTLNGRVNSTSVVTQPDLLAMMSMINGFRVNVAILLAFAIRHQAQVKVLGVFCGAYITRILKNMNIFPAEEPTDVVVSSFFMTTRLFHHWGIRQNPSKEKEPTPPVSTPAETQGLEIQRLSADIQILKHQQRKTLKLQRFLVASLKTIGEKLKIQLPDCLSGSSSEDDDQNRPTDISAEGPSKGTETHVDQEDEDIDRQIDDYQEEEGGTEILDHGSLSDDAGTDIPVTSTEKNTDKSDI